MDNISNILNKKELVCVIGLGIIGLPTTLHISKYYDVVGFDISSTALERAKSFGLTVVSEQIPYADIYVITINTGLNNDGSPDVSNIYDVSDKISKLRPDALVCIESTLPVGTSSRVAERFSLNYVVHCPHRYWKGDPIRHGVVQTRVFGALNKESHEKGKKFYYNQKIPIKEVSSIEIAELTKIAENAYRFAQISFAEELKMICEHIELPFEKVREACNTKWNIEILEARDGIGGDCLPKDIRYLFIILNTPLLDGAIKADKKYKETREI